MRVVKPIAIGIGMTLCAPLCAAAEPVQYVINGPFDSTDADDPSFFLESGGDPDAVRLIVEFDPLVGPVSCDSDPFGETCEFVTSRFLIDFDGRNVDIINGRVEVFNSSSSNPEPSFFVSFYSIDAIITIGGVAYEMDIDYDFEQTGRRLTTAGAIPDPGTLNSAQFREAEIDFYPVADDFEENLVFDFRPIRVGTPLSIFYINGVQNTRADANQSAYILRQAIDPALLDIFGGDDFEIGILYNPHETIVKDLYQSYRMLIDDDASFRVFLRRFKRATGWGPDLEDLTLKQTKKYFDTFDPESAILEGHVTTLKRRIEAGEKIVLVSHSQGNLYANAIYGKLDPIEQLSVRIVSVATPASFTAGGGSYTTDHGDLLITSIPTSRDWNVDNNFDILTKSWLDLLGHAFGSYYMSDFSKSRSEIGKNVDNAILDLME